MDAYNVELMYDILIWIIRRKDPQDPMIHICELFKGMNRLYMTKDEVSRELIAKELLLNGPIKNLLNLACERAMVDPTERDELVKFVKGLDPQSTEYSMLPEAVKNLLKD